MTNLEAVLSGSRKWTVELGDCRALLRLLPDNCIDAVVTDPPYEISFMSRSWDSTGIAFDVEMWRDVLRVLKPGGQIVSFGGTRTYHRMACAIEDAGLWFRDQLDWLQGQGMPKGQNISKAIDKKAGAKRKVVGQRTLTGNAAQTTKEKGGTYASGTDSRGVPPKMVDVTAPATDDAKKWDGWGTGLRPLHEPIALAMKPLDGTFEANVRKWGVGGLNVNACRLASPTGAHAHWSRDDGSGLTTPSGYEGGFQGGGARSDDGRWPPNVLLSHAPECELIGTRRVKANPTWNENHGSSMFGNGQQADIHATRHADEDGFETLEDWACAPWCPVGTLDGQGGWRESGTLSGTENAPTTNVVYSGGARRSGVTYGDAGTVSRYFATFPYEPPFYYEPKVDREERERGIDWMDAEVVDDGRHTPNDTPYQRGKTLRKNKHPTVKPINIIRWLSRLICPPGGLILDPFCGSGTGGIAALAEGFRWIGFELKANHVELARARIVGDAPLFNLER